MTSYHGGKQKIGAEIAEVMADTVSASDVKGYCEPFCGMLGVYQHIPEHFPQCQYLAGDANGSVIKMWAALQDGWLPSANPVTKSQFLSMAKTKKSSAEKGFIGHQYGYMGKYFKPFKERTKAANEKVINKLQKIAEELSDVKFTEGEYTQFSRLKKFVIYCDPPYEVQNCYYHEGDSPRQFDNEEFWQWCRNMSKNNVVFVSEQDAPKDFDEIWSDGPECLFLHS